MPRFRHIQSNFRGGEISPAMWGRTDLDVYGSAAEELLNNIVRSEGGSARRPGTQFLKRSMVLYRPYNTVGLPVAETLNGGVPVTLTGKVRMFPFIFNRDEAYCVAMTQFGGQTGIAIINVDTLAESVITPFANTTWWSNSRFLTYASAAELDEVQIAQTGDLLFFTHPSYPPFYLARTSVNAFDIRPWWVNPLTHLTGAGVSSINLFGERGVPYFLNLRTDILFSAPATMGGFNQTLNSSVAYFTPDMVNTVFKINVGGVSHYRFVTAYVSATSVTTQSGLSGAKAAIASTANWEQSEWSTNRGWPRAISFFEQRLFFGGTFKKPDTTWGSEISDIFEFDILGAVTDAGYGTPVASDPFAFTFASTEVNQIQWLSSSKVLNTGTLGREYTSKGVQSALSPLDLSVSSETSHGSQFRQALRSENGIFFITRTGKKIREFVFSWEEDSFQAYDVTRLANHMLNKTLSQSYLQNRPEINHLVKQEAEEILIWILDKNGGLFATTKDREAEINAFHYHVFGGSYNNKIPEVQSVIALPSADGTNDDLWVAIQRTINGSPVTYIERINKEFNLEEINNSSNSILDKLVYCDSAVFFKPGGSFTVVTGLTHLEGQSVVAVCNGSYRGVFTVTGGQITLPSAATEAVVGLSYLSRIKTLNMEDGSGIGSSQGAIKKFDQLTIRFHRTIGVKYGFDAASMIELDFRPPTISPDAPIPLFTGDKLVQFPMNYDREARLIIEQTLPLPCTVTALIARGMTND